MSAADLTEVPVSDKSLRVLVVDDHTAVREGLTAIIEAQPGLMVVGAASSGEAGVAMAAEVEPDVVLMDLHMPGMNGVDATSRIVADNPRTFVLVQTMDEDDESVFAALRAGARGYLLKDAKLPEIVRAVRGVAAGEAVFGPGVADRIIKHFKKEAAPSDPAEVIPDPVDVVSVLPPGLTVREREILDLIAAGHDNTEIRRQLVLSPKTVRNHISNIFAKLQVPNRNVAIVRAREAGLGQKKQT
jgi:DNA-binding NarL/FixJ family response regulator